MIFEIMQSAYPDMDCNYGYDTILFRGDYCNLLSEGASSPKDEKSNQEMKEQIKVIIDQLPQLEPHDLSFIDRADYKKLKKIQALTSDRSKNEHFFYRLAPEMPEGMDELLDNLLKFNPYMRWSAKECLESSIF